MHLRKPNQKDVTVTIRELGPDTLISVVAPVFNEESIVRTFVAEVLAELKAVAPTCRHEIVLVDDGSSDASPQTLDELAEEHAGVLQAVHLSRNFGHQLAVCAGLDHARGDLVILMDSDLQDDPHAFGPFLRNWQAGYDVVYAVRSSREESLPSRLAFGAFYRLLQWIAEIRLPLDAGTFSLMDRRVVDGIRTLGERNLYFPGLRAWVGFRQTGVEMARRSRHDRESRVGFRGLWRLSMNAFFAFSYVPVFVFRLLGVFSLLIALGMLAWSVGSQMIRGHQPASVMSGMIVTVFFAGINLLGIGVIGEYVARIYDEVKARPRYLVARVAGRTAAPIQTPPVCFHDI